MRPIEVAHNIDARLAELRRWAESQMDAKDDEQHWLARLPAEILRILFDLVSPSELAALLTAGSRHLLATALVTNADMAVDALWWHLWHLPATSRQEGLGAPRVPTDPVDASTQAVVYPGGAYRAVWMYGRCKWVLSSVRFSSGVMVRPVAIDDAHIVNKCGAAWDSGCAVFTSDPDGVGALALSAARLCTPRVLAAIARLPKRYPRGFYPLVLLEPDDTDRPLIDVHSIDGTRDSADEQRCHGDIVEHLIVQCAYHGRSDMAWLACLDKTNGGERWAPDGEMLASHVARAALVTDSLDHKHVLLHSPWITPYGIAKHHPLLVRVWAPVAASALAAGHEERARRLIQRGVHASLSQLLTDGPCGRVSSDPLVECAINLLMADRRPERPDLQPVLMQAMGIVHSWSPAIRERVSSRHATVLPTLCRLIDDLLAHLLDLLGVPEQDICMTRAFWAISDKYDEAYHPTPDIYQPL